MPDLLLELFSEEIPARMQAQAARDLERMARERLASADLAYRTIRSFAGPRRLTLAVDGLPDAQADRAEERRGPRANAPDKAVEGFLRSTGLTRDQLTERDGQLFATLHHRGRATSEIVAEMVEAIVRGFPWPKSMRWGAGSLRWVRPLKRILCTLDGEVVSVEIDTGAGVIVASDLTEGHRFLGPDRGPFTVSGVEDYAERLADHYVMLDPAERRARIAAGAEAVCAARGLEWVRDEGLLDEVVGLAEWPVPILGDMDAGFLDLPAEVIRTSMRVHQRYFAVRDPATGALAPHFVVVANIEPQDGGAVIAHGNARVLTARLSDARFFWTEDQKAGNFDRWAKKLEGVTFHAKLGTMAERVDRIAALARAIAPLVGADPKLAEMAARLSKVDLASGMVGEFPELQGIMGGYYVRALEPFLLDGGRAGMGVPTGVSGEGGPALQAPDGGADTPIPDPSPIKGEGRSLAGLTPAEIEVVADAVRDHYKPLGPSDNVPAEPVTVAVALADKLDTLAAFFAIDERPTGSKDPYALRRAALGVIRLILNTSARLPTRNVLTSRFWHWSLALGDPQRRVDVFHADPRVYQVPRDAEAARVQEAGRKRQSEIFQQLNQDAAPLAEQLLAFFADRLKVLLRDEGKRHDLVDAVFAPINEQADDDLVRIVRRVEALSAFLATEDGASLLAGYKRAANILRAEAKKTLGDEDHALDWDLGLLEQPQEQALSAALRTVQGEVDRALEAEDFEAAMRHLAHLRAPVDAFFDKVLVNVPDPALRLNRLRLLGGVRDTANRVADFSRVGG